MQSNHESVRSWPVSWDRPPATILPAAVRKAIRDAGPRNTRMMQALRNVRATSLHDARRLQRRYLLSNSAKLAAFVDAWQRTGRRVSKATDDDVVDLVKLTVAHHPLGKIDEQAFAWPKHKRDGAGYRIIHKLRFRQSAQDKLAACAARCLVDLLPTQFNQTGKGMRKLDAWLVEHLPKTMTVITVDIPSCFNVVDRSSVEVSLLLPQRVVEMALFDVMDMAKHKPVVLTGILTTEPNDVATSSAKRGIPQGSALAQVASEIEIDKVLRKVASVDPAVHVAAYGDNLIFLLDDATLLGSVYSALTASALKNFGEAATSELSTRRVPERYLRVLLRAASKVSVGETSLSEIMDYAFAPEIDHVLIPVGFDSFKEWMLELRIARRVSKGMYLPGPLCGWWVENMKPSKDKTSAYAACLEQRERIRLKSLC